MEVRAAAHTNVMTKVDAIEQLTDLLSVTFCMYFTVVVMTPAWMTEDC